MVNRAALILRYKTPALRWIIESDPFETALHRLTLQEVNRDRAIYLISDADAESDEHWRRWVERNFQALFESELSAWCEDPETWPEPLTMTLFDEWFDIECHSILLDTVGDAIVDEDEDDIYDLPTGPVN